MFEYTHYIFELYPQIELALLEKHNNTTFQRMNLITKRTNTVWQVLQDWVIVGFLFSGNKQYFFLWRAV